MFNKLEFFSSLNLIFMKTYPRNIKIFVFPSLKGVFLALCVLLTSAFTTQDIFEDIGLAIKSGNAKEVSQFFSSNVELKIKEKEDVYSKTQAEHIVKEFFAKHQPESFNIIHRGTSKKGARYAIGKLKTSNGAFRTYFFVKNIDDSQYIHELRFEED